MFRFTTRDLLWLMVVVGLAACWWIDSRIQAAMRRSDWAEAAEHVAALERAAETAGFKFAIGPNGWSLIPNPTVSQPTSTTPPVPK